MGSRWQVDRGALNQGLRGGSSQNRRRIWVFGVAFLVVVGLGAATFLLLGGEDAPTTTTVPTATETTPPPTTTPLAVGGETPAVSATSSTATTAAVTTTTAPVPIDLSEVPVLTEAEAYDPSGQARLVYVTGSASDWIVDLATGSLGQVTDRPGTVAAGLVVRDGSLIVEADGRIWRRPPGGVWADLSLSPDGAFAIVGYYPSDDHLHVYLRESADGGFGAPRLHNVQLFYDDPSLFEPKWVADGTDVVRVSSSGDHTLVMVERATDGGAPTYDYLTETTGAPVQQSAAPAPAQAGDFIWGAEFLDGRRVFYLACTGADDFPGCGASEPRIVDLSTGVIVDARTELPSFSTEFALPGQTSPMAAAFGSSLLLTRSNVTLVDLVTGASTRLLRGSER